MTTASLEFIRERIHAARVDLAQVMNEAQKAATRAIAEGMSEVEVARALGVDRSRTLRRWLGK
jgi:DNA-binding CsgD family transcriptional regulator